MGSIVGFCGLILYVSGSCNNRQSVVIFFIK